MKDKLDLLKAETEYIAQQNNPLTAIGGGLRYLCELKNVKYFANEPDSRIRKRLLKKIESEEK